MDFNDKIARASLHIEVADRVRDMIFDGSLPPGVRIDELDLCAKLGTSRTPLREALKVLANDGLVRLAPGRGAFVTELAPQEVDSLFPVLAMLEGRCAAEAVRRQTATDVRKLSGIHHKMEEHVAAGDVDAYHQATDQLHRMLHTIAANPWLLRATTDLRRFLRLARGTSQRSDGRLLNSLAEHRTLMKTIARGDAESAEQIMHHHLLAQQKAWRATHLKRQREESPSDSAPVSFVEPSPVSFVDSSAVSSVVSSTKIESTEPAQGPDARGLAPATPGTPPRTTATADRHAEAEPIGV